MFELLFHPVISGLLIMAFIGALVYKLHFVDVSGLISAFVVGFTVWYTGGVAAFVILLFFFVSSGVATKYKYKAKAKVNLAQEGKGKRSWRNVFGSGLIPMIFSIGIYLAQPGLFTTDPFWSFAMFGGFVGAVATTSADTLASEIGVFSKSKPRLITNLRRKVPRGTIGAVSLLGELVAVFAGVAIGVIAILFALLAPGWVPVSNFDQLIVIFPLAVLTAFMGCNLDSLIGAVLQNRFVCEICGAIVDKEFHCDYETKYVGGYKRFTNMHVNFGSSVMGSSLGIILGAGLFVWILGGLFIWILASSSN
ncbi:MAG: DUF92 domain-containing protein [Candidatus Thorarchaeota archaeon]|nr:DUF92 domain-containing protein [Candidatus Thorarchaeota archaeon]